MRKIIAILALSLAFASVQAATLHVPSEYPTISAAVALANDGDSVVVAPGVYAQNIYITNAIVLVSSGGAEVTTIDGSALPSGILVDFNVDPAKVPVLDGFTLTGSNSGAAVQTDNSSPIIKNCIVRDNQNAGIWGDSSNTVVRNCSITGNQSAGIWFFGGNFTSYGNCVVSDCYIANNGQLPSVAKQPDAVNNGGGVWMQSMEHALVQRCVFVNNQANNNGGGVMMTASGPAVVENCTFVSNRVLNAVGDQVCFFNAPEGRVTNCIFVGLADSPRYALAKNSASAVQVTYCDFWNTPLGGDANFIIPNPIGILHADPKFDALSPDGYGLLGGSPMIDTGDPLYPVPQGGGLRIDIGAHEYTGCTPGDANLDRRVNISDAVLIIGYIFLGLDLPGGPACASVDGNCTISISDAVYLIKYIFGLGPAPLDPGC